MCWYIFVPFSVYFEQSEITETESNNGTEITDVTEVEDDLLEGENDNDLDNEDQDRKPPLRYVSLGNNGTPRVRASPASLCCVLEQEH